MSGFRACGSCRVGRPARLRRSPSVPRHPATRHATRNSNCSEHPLHDTSGASIHCCEMSGTTRASRCLSTRHVGCELAVLTCRNVRTSSISKGRAGPTQRQPRQNARRFLACRRPSGRTRAALTAPSAASRESARSWLQDEHDVLAAPDTSQQIDHRQSADRLAGERSGALMRTSTPESVRHRCADAAVLQQRGESRPLRRAEGPERNW